MVVWFFLGIQVQDIDPRVKQMYEGVRDVLIKYRSGKVPKAFKIIPKLRNWEQILYITGFILIIIFITFSAALLEVILQFSFY